MANYYATARSNYLAVKDEAAFIKWAGLIGLTILTPDFSSTTADGIRRFGITPGNNSNSGAWSAHVWGDEAVDYAEIDLPAQLATHLADGEVAVLMEAGHEGLRYVTGAAIAVNSHGKTVSINLDKIYHAARKLGPHITRAMY